MATVEVIDAKSGGNKTVVVTPKGNGTAWITAKSADGQNAASCEVTVTGFSSGIGSNNQLLAGVYANGDGSFTIEVSNGETCNVTVANLQGQIVKRETMRGGSHVVNIGNHPAGVYVFVVDDGRQKTTVKVVKR